MSGDRPDEAGEAEAVLVSRDAAAAAAAASACIPLLLGGGFTQRSKKNDKTAALWEKPFTSALSWTPPYMYMTL